MGQREWREGMNGWMVGRIGLGWLGTPQLAGRARAEFERLSIIDGKRGGREEGTPVQRRLKVWSGQLTNGWHFGCRDFRID